ncbi:hypothetical protein ABK040_010068 [Willaertia magna]
MTCGPKLEITECKNEEHINLLQKFTKLKALDILFCNFKDEHLQKLNNLTELNINRCLNINGTCFKYLNNLKTLTLENTNTPDTYLNNLNNLNKLLMNNCFEINNNHFLENLKQLTSLQLNNILNFNVTYLNNLNNLKELTLNNCAGINDFNFLQNLPNLNSLVLSKNRKNCLSTNFSLLNDNELMFTRNLQILKLEIHSSNSYYDCNSNITGTCFNNLNKLEHLEGSLFNLEENNLQYLINLKHLILFQHSKPISGKYFKYLKNLRTLSFLANDKFKEKYLRNLPLLESLYVKDNVKFVGEYLNELKYLTNLNVANTNIEDKYLINLKSLKVLDLNNCKLITGECLLKLSNLQKLYLNNCLNLNEIYLSKLIYLQDLEINKCNIVNGQFLLNLNYLQYFYFENKSCNENELLLIKFKLNNLQNNLKEVIKLIFEEKFTLSHHYENIEIVDKDEKTYYELYGDEYF